MPAVRLTESEQQPPDSEGGEPDLDFVEAPTLQRLRPLQAALRATVAAG